MSHDGVRPTLLHSYYCKVGETDGTKGIQGTMKKRNIKVNRFEFHGREFDAVIENGRVEVTDKDTGEKHIRTK